MAADLNKEVNLEELEAKYLKHVEDRLEYIYSALSQQEADEDTHTFMTRVLKARNTTQFLIEFKNKIKVDFCY